MLLEKMFQRYLTECSYKHIKLDEEELEEELDMDEEECIVDEDIEYHDIKELTMSQVRELRNKKIHKPLTKMEEAELEKYYFQINVIVNRNNWDKNELDLWNIYKNYGKGKFRNLAYEKGLKDGTVRICDIVSEVYPEIGSKLALQIELIDEMCGVLGLKHSQDFTQVSKERIDNCVDWFKNNSEKIHNVFEIRDRKKIAKFDSRTTAEIINKVFSKWGYSKIKAGTKSKKRVNGEVVYTTPYNIKNTNIDEEKNQDVDVYLFIRPKKIKNSERKVTLHTGVMPPI